ncbi:hypothetical protein KJ965_04315 [Patescibacteria group bacterium]|nr:hypothetical protein [Patescibacteria group bacterium]
MTILDDFEAIKNIDIDEALKSIDSFLDQCRQALEETEKLNLPNLQGKVDNIVVSGMGGSAFTPEIVKTLFSDEIKLPYEIIREYHLPGYVNSRSLVIISSYSGTTAEAIACGKEALKRSSTVLIICSQREGSELLLLAKEKNLNGYIFKETYNPSRQPRLGGGYTVCGHAGLLIKTGLLKTDFQGLKQAVESVQTISSLDMKKPLRTNPAKQLAEKLYKKFPVLIASEFLCGAIHGFANQLNESAKTNSVYHFIPEFNHHRMEGFEFPAEFKNQGACVFYPSDLYDKRIQKRYQLTKDIVNQNGLVVLEYQPQAPDKIAQTLETVVFNSYVSYYLAILYKKNPLLIPWVDYFKTQLKKKND